MIEIMRSGLKIGLELELCELKILCGIFWIDNVNYNEKTNANIIINVTANANMNFDC